MLQAWAERTRVGGAKWHECALLLWQHPMCRWHPMRRLCCGSTLTMHRQQGPPMLLRPCLTLAATASMSSERSSRLLGRVAMEELMPCTR